MEHIRGGELYTLVCACGTKLEASVHYPIEQDAFKNVNNFLNINMYSYLETSGGQSSNLYLNEVHFFYASVN